MGALSCNVLLWMNWQIPIGFVLFFLLKNVEVVVIVAASCNSSHGPRPSL